MASACGPWESIAVAWENVNVKWEELGACVPETGGAVFGRFIHFGPWHEEKKREEALLDKQEEQRQKAIANKKRLLAAQDNSAKEKARLQARYDASMQALRETGAALHAARVALAAAEQAWREEIEADDQEILMLLSMID